MGGDKDWGSVLDQFARHLAAGGGAGAISRTLTAPIERVKTLLQVQAVSKVPVDQQYKGIVDCLVRIPREQGVLAYWRGNGVNVVRIIPNSAIKFSTYTHYKKLALPKGEAAYEGKEKFLRKMFCGGLSGITTIIPVYPLDLARTRLSADTQGKYKGVVHLIRSTIEIDGVRGLYNGIGISLCGIAPYLAISMSTYDWLKDITRGEAHWQHPLGKVLLGSFAAILSQSFAYPMDTIRRHMQVSGALGQRRLYSGTFDCIRKIYQTHGFKGYYKGLLANAARAAPQTGIEYAAFDIIVSLVTQPQGDQKKPFRATKSQPAANPQTATATTTTTTTTTMSSSNQSVSIRNDAVVDERNNNKNTNMDSSSSSSSSSSKSWFSFFPSVLTGTSQTTRVVEKDSIRTDDEEEEEDEEELEDSASSRLIRRLSSTLPAAEEARINRVFSALIEKSEKTHNNTIPHDELVNALMNLGYEEYEVKRVIGPAAQVKMIDFMEFRRLCQDTKVLDLLEQQFDDM